MMPSQVLQLTPPARLLTQQSSKCTQTWTFDMSGSDAAMLTLLSVDSPGKQQEVSGNGHCPLNIIC